MNPSSSHTHCQVAQADTQAKTWQRVCLPHPEKIELKKFSIPSENKKYANAQPNDRRKSVAKQTPKPLTGQRFNYSVVRRPACNSGFAKKRVQWLIEHSTSHQILWYVDSLVLRNPLLRKAANVSGKHKRQTRKEKLNRKMKIDIAFNVYTVSS